jgi:hypothetical protein
MTRAMKMIHFPKTRLSELAARSGGVERELAVEEAKKSIEDLRDLALETIEAAIRAIETIAYSAKRNQLAQSEMKEVLRLADQVVTMAATFGLESLECAVKSLCDVTDGLLTRESNDAAPIVVHVQTMRLLAPGGATLDAEQTQRVLSELTKVRAHFHFAPLSLGAKPEFGPPEIAK